MILFVKDQDEYRLGQVVEVTMGERHLVFRVVKIEEYLVGESHEALDRLTGDGFVVHLKESHDG